MISSQTFQKGFTLIELLVVISIIALLSTVVLSSLSQARNKAIRAGHIQQMQEYASAVRQYRVEHDAFPNFSRGCVGTNSDCKVLVYTLTEATVFSNTIQPYMALLPDIQTQTLKFNTLQNEGAAVECSSGYTDSNGVMQCSNVRFTWIEPGTDQCKGATATLVNVNTICYLDIDVR